MTGQKTLDKYKVLRDQIDNLNEQIRINLICLNNCREAREIVVADLKKEVEWWKAEHQHLARVERAAAEEIASLKSQLSQAEAEMAKFKEITLWAEQLSAAEARGIERAAKVVMAMRDIGGLARTTILARLRALKPESTPNG